MKRVQQAVDLLDQIIEKSSIDDKMESKNNPDISQDGDGWITYNLKLVKELLDEELKESSNA